MQHCSANEIQMRVTQADQIAHARELGLAQFVSEVDQSIDK